MVDVGAGHLAFQGNPADGVHIGALLGGADGGDGELAQAVGFGHQAADIFGGDARHSARRRQKDDIRPGLGEGADVLAGEDVLAALAHHARGVHLPGSQGNSVAHGLGDGLEGLHDGLVAHAVARISREDDEVDAHVRRPDGVFHRGIPPPAHGPEGIGIVSGQGVVHRLQIDADEAAGERLDPAHRVLRRRLGQGQDVGIPDVKHIEQQQICAHGSGKLSVGDVGKQGLGDADGLSGQHPSLAAGHGGEEVFFGEGNELRGEQV